jgi:hypothetical protein
MRSNRHSTRKFIFIIGAAPGRKHPSGHGVMTFTMSPGILRSRIALATHLRHRIANKAPAPRLIAERFLSDALKQPPQIL